MKILLCVCERERESYRRAESERDWQEIQGWAGQWFNHDREKGAGRGRFSLTEGEVVGGVNFLFWNQ